MSDIASQQGEQGNVQPSSEQNSADGQQQNPNSQPSQAAGQEPSSSPSKPTDTSGGTASDESSTSQSNSSGEGQSLLEKIEGAVEGAIEKVEGEVSHIAQEVKDFVAGTPAVEAEKLGNAPPPPKAPEVPVIPKEVVASNAASIAFTETAVSATSAAAPSAAPIVVGQVVSPGAPVTPPAVAQTPVTPIAKEESVVLNTVQTGITDVDNVVENLMKGASIEAKIIINTIKEYIVAMKPGKPIAQKDAVMQQVGFYNAILGAINNLEADFRPTMQAILALLHAHKDGAFKETHVFRYIESVPLSADHRTGWRKLTTLLKTLANPATRQDLLRQMNFDPLVKHGLSERGRTKLAAFFGK